jgi:ribonuclease M5
LTSAKLKEVIVVEGRNDTLAIKRALDADTIETRGSAIGEEVLAQIKRAQASRGVIVFTDPDHAGERIRRIISREIEGVKHAFLAQHEARGKRKVGVEHASPDAIRAALGSVRTEWTDPRDEPPLTWEEYIELGFVGQPASSGLRREVAELLGIGYGNAKQFYRRLQVLCITREEIFQALERVGKDAVDES